MSDIPTVYVGHRFNFKNIWPQIVSYLHKNNGYINELPVFKTHEEITYKFEIGTISEEQMDQYNYMCSMYSTGSYNFIAFEYFRTIAQEYGLEIFIHNDYNNLNNVMYIDIGLSFKKENENENHSVLSSAETVMCNIDFINRLSLNELPFFSYCTTVKKPQIFYIMNNIDYYD